MFINLSIKRTAFTPVWICAALFLSCSNDYNPFTDPSNASVIVKHKSFRDIDTIGIFTTETLKVAVSARDLVDSFSIAATNNRLFIDTIIRARPALIIPPDVFTFYLSFADTGWQKVTIGTFRKNDDKVSIDYSLFCTSPLHQDSIGGTYNDSIVLSTNPVADENVVYHWDFGDGAVFEKSTPFAKALIASFLSGKTGSLWVSDNLLKNNSPKTHYSFSFKDTSGPIIVCINNNVRNDTVQTGDSTFAFLVRIIDLQNTANISATFNGQEKDFFDENQKVFVKNFYGVTGHGPSSPLAVRIKATDIFNNVSEKIFYIVYNAAIGRVSGPVIFVKSPSLDVNNIAMSSTKEKLIFGSIENYSTQPFDVLVRLRVNGALQPKVDSMPAAYSGLWTFNTLLVEGPNVMTVIASTTAGDSCAGESFTVIYNPASLKNDTTPPVILDISAGGSQGPQNFYTAKDSLVLRIIAVDEGTGIRTMLMSGVPVNSSSEGKGFIWYDAVKTFHSRTAGRVRIIATDSNNNSIDTSVYVYKNRLPQIVTPLNPPDPLVAGTAYRDKIVIFDPDTDTVLVSKISGPASLMVFSNGSIEWTPLASDVGSNQLIIELSDGFQIKTYLCTLVVVVSTGAAAQPVRFVTTAQDFPLYLEAGKDSLMVPLQTINGTAPLVFSAVIRMTNTAVPVLGTIVQWKPALSDTGQARLMVTVSDAGKSADTLLAAFLVAPPNRPFTLSMVQTAPLAADSSLDMSKAAGPDTLRFTINDPDNSLVERHTVEIIQSHSATVSALDSSRSFMVIVDPRRVGAALLKDTLEVIVTDRAGHADTVTYGVVYHTVARTKQIKMNTTSAGNGAAVFAPVTTFPMLVRLDKTTFDFSTVNNAGSPIGFNKPDGTPLPFEIERWDSSGGQAEIWVLVDTVFGNDSTHSITMSWEPSGPAPQSNGAAVFDTANGFQGVWHFSEGTNSIAADATINAYNCTPNGALIDTTGIIGRAKVFDGRASYFAMLGTASGKLNFPMGGPFTISAWVNTDILDGNYHCAISKGDYQYGLQLTLDNQWLFFDFDNTRGWMEERCPAVINTWKYIVGVRNGVNEYLYEDGILVNSTVVNYQGSGRNVSNIVTLGKLSGSSSRFFNGKIDEVRMSNVVRSGGWIKLCYENQRPGSGFITFK